MPSQLLHTPATQTCAGVPAHVRFRTPSPAMGRTTAPSERSPSMAVDVWRAHPPLKRTTGASPYAMPMVLVDQERYGKDDACSSITVLPTADKEPQLDGIQQNRRSNAEKELNRAKG
ncbi:hypothetical protein Aduo_008673 [Ancylostoma duodenale]